jgi:TonB family protein
MRENAQMLWLAPASELPRIKGRALWTSLFAHGLLVALLFSVTFPETARRVRYQVTPLFLPRPEPRAERSLPPPHTRSLKPLIVKSPSRLLAPAARTHPLAATLPAPAGIVVLPEAPRQTLPVPVMDPPRPNPPAGGAFTAGTYQAPTPASAPEKKAPLPVVTAGFAGPAGSAPAPAPQRAVVTGAFGEGVRAEGPVAHRAARAAGAFDSIPAAAGQPSAMSKVSSAHFESVSTTTASTPVKTGAGVVSAHTSLEILQKPRPIYSEEARRLHLEGEVVLEALFSASGRIQVIRVIHGLGHGLDENAIEAASHIRFHPATENGVPVDTVAVVRIAFQVAY